jgi:plastocyanin
MRRMLTSLLRSIALLGLAMEASSAGLTVAVQERDGKAFPGAIVTLYSEGGSLPALAPVHATVDQVNLAFVPDLLVIPVGSTVEFPNSDLVSHQVYSFSSPRRFQLPLYRGKPYPPVRFEQPGLVTLGCNIHDNMLAYVLVTDAQLFGRTDARGSWVAADVPPGRYRVRTWHPRMSDAPESLERPVTVTESGTQVVLRLSSALRPAAMGGRPRSWDAY